tara:strand:+ start:152678 stop:153574 length:897 start_codon:yes stop_codon:yes gene_type:complete
MFKYLKFLNSKKFKDLQRVIEYGETEQKLDLFKLRQSKFSQVNTPVFFLSSGRCGTAWLSQVLESKSNLKVYHHPEPVMRSQGKLAYEMNLNIEDRSESEKKLMKELFLAGREELLLNCARANRRPIFTDSRSSFFAQQMLEIFPNAKFVHIHRHPGEFVRSGIRRSWYKAEQQSELNRIEPLPNSPYYEDWKRFSDIEKISWLWLETNTFIEEFSNTLNPNNFFEISFNFWSPSKIEEMMTFLNIDLKEAEISSWMGKRINAQSESPFPKYQDWPKEDQQSLKNICSELAAKYNYQL